MLLTSRVAIAQCCKESTERTLARSETVSQCHSEPKAKNLVFVSSKKCEMLRSAQHDTCRTFRIARQPPKGEGKTDTIGYTYHSCALSDSLALWERVKACPGLDPGVRASPIERVRVLK